MSTVRCVDTVQLAYDVTHLKTESELPSMSGSECPVVLSGTEAPFALSVLLRSGDSVNGNLSALLLLLPLPPRLSLPLPALTNLLVLKASLDSFRRPSLIMSENEKASTRFGSGRKKGLASVLGEFGEGRLERDASALDDDRVMETERDSWMRVGLLSDGRGGGGGGGGDRGSGVGAGGGVGGGGGETGSGVGDGGGDGGDWGTTTGGAGAGTTTGGAGAGTTTGGAGLCVETGGCDVTGGEWWTSAGSAEPLLVTLTAFVASRPCPVMLMATTVTPPSDDDVDDVDTRCGAGVFTDVTTGDGIRPSTDEWTAKACVDVGPFAVPCC